MAVIANNELSKLLDLAFGENYAAFGMRERTEEELKSVESLATDTAEMAMNQLEALGRFIGTSLQLRATDETTLSSLGWLVASTAELASVTMHMAERARAMRNPEDRAFLLAHGEKL